MTNKNLYIIGNGFDIHHEIKSSYSHFKEYLTKNAPKIFECFIKYVITEENWSNFEEALAELDIDYILDNCGCYLKSYGADDWSDSYHHDYEYEIDIIIENLTNHLEKNFSEWIQQLYIPTPDTIRSELYLNLNINSYYLNFNYTPTLNELYNISKTNILHIHGKRGNLAPLVYGHGIEPNAAYLTARGEIRSKDDLHLREDDENDDPRVVAGRNIIKNYFLKTRKPCEEIISSNTPFFQQLKYISRICVLGHSLNKIDTPYFEEIVKHINRASVRWEISYFKKSDKEKFPNIISTLGIDPELIEEPKKLEQFKKVV